MRLRHVLRRLARTPSFTLIAAVTVAVGIGANSAIFSVINGVLLKPLPYPHPDELVEVSHTAFGVHLPDAGSAPFLHFTYRELGRSFQDLGLFRWSNRTVTHLTEPETVLGLNVTGQVLPILGVPPILGHWFSEKEDAPGSPPTAILMNGWWQARFGGDRSVIGRDILVDGIARQVIGVMPATFRFLDRDAAFLLPLQLDRNKAVLGQVDFRGIARLKPHVTLEQASADIARMIPIALHSFPPQPGLTVKDFEEVRFAPKLQYLKHALIGDIAQTLWVLMGTIGIVLLIACANVANLLLVRAEGRQQELAIRAALGAGWRQIAQELLMESVALGLLGGLLGLGLAYGAIRALIAMAPAHLPRLHDISIDPAVILFTFAIALATGVLFGAIPVIKYAGPRISGALRAGGRTASQSRERHRAGNFLVVVQVALALVLLVGSGLMIKTFQALRRVDPGFHPQDALTLRLSIPPARVKDPVAVVQMEQGILEKIRAIPGVIAVGITTVIPTEPGSYDQVYARDRSYQSVPPLRRLKFVSPGLLAAMGNRLVAGREFTWTDTYERRPVTMLSENLARELWRDPRNAIGQQIAENLKGPWREVIGVVSDEREDGMQQKAPPVAYYPLLMNNFEGSVVATRRVVSFIVRSTRAGSQSLLSDVQQAVWSMDPDLPLANVRTLQEIYDKSNGPHLIHAGHAGHRRRDGAVDRTDWNLRRDRVLGLAKDPRDRDPHGLGSPPEGADAPVCGARRGARRSRRWLRLNLRRGADARAGSAVVRCEPARSADLCRGFRGIDRRRGHRKLHSGTAGRGCRSLRGAARGLVRQRIGGFLALLTAGYHKRADARGRGGRAALQVVAQEPEGTVVGRIHDDVGVVLPAQAASLRRLTLRQHRLVERQLALLVVRPARGEALAGEVGTAAERIADADVSLAVHGHTSQPAIESAGRVGPLLVQNRVAPLIQAELVPTHAASLRGGGHRVLGQDGFLTPDSAIHQPLDQLVALRIEPAGGPGLRNAAAQLAVAEIVIGSHRDLSRRRDGGLRRIVPVDVHLVKIDSVIVEDLHQLRAPGGHHEVRRTLRRRTHAIHVRVQQENGAVDDHALLGGGKTLEHPVAVGDAIVLLRDHARKRIVAGAGGIVVAIRPNRRARIVGKQGPLKFVAVIPAQRIGGHAHGIAHGVRTLRVIRRPREDRNHDEPASR